MTAVVYRTGPPCPGRSVTADAGRGSLSLFSVSHDRHRSAGLLYLDELHLTDPKSAVGAAAKGRLELELPGTLASIGGHPVLHDLSLRQEASAASKGFSSLYGTPQQQSSLSSRTELSVGISVVDLDADLQVAASGAEMSLAGGHRLTFPTVGFPITFLDTFSLRQSATGLDLARSNRLGVSLARLGTLGLEAGAISQEGLLTQTWKADYGLTPWGLDLRQSLELTETRSGYVVPEQGLFLQLDRGLHPAGPLGRRSGGGAPGQRGPGLEPDGPRAGGPPGRELRHLQRRDPSHRTHPDQHPPPGGQPAGGRAEAGGGPLLPDPGLPARGAAGRATGLPRRPGAGPG